MNRINDFIKLDKKEISLLFAQFDKSLIILDFSLIEDSMGNSGYVVTATSKKYFLKLYSNVTNKIEIAVYKKLIDKINIPKLYYYDDSKQLFPFAYTITEYLEGVTFMQYTQKNLKYPPEMVFEIGKMCATIHEREYAYDALLDDELNVLEKLPRTSEKILYLLNGKPAEYLQSETVEKLRKFIKEKPDLFNQIESQSVLCHGDVNYNNIILSDERIYFIDFEFAYSGSIYHDIGHFFRRKDDDIQALIDENIYDAFQQGYNSVSENKLPSDWLLLAHLCDINALLCLLTRDNVPEDWIADIEYDILYAIS